MDAFSDNLARNIIKEVLEDYKESRSGPSGSSGRPSRLRSSTGNNNSSRSQSANHSPLTGVRNGHNTCVRKRKTAKEEAEIKYIGIRPGEKIHEQMISSEDSPFTYEYKYQNQ